MKPYCCFSRAHKSRQPISGLPASETWLTNIQWCPEMLLLRLSNTHKSHQQISGLSPGIGQQVSVRSTGRPPLYKGVLKLSCMRAPLFLYIKYFFYNSQGKLPEIYNFHNQSIHKFWPNNLKESKNLRAIHPKASSSDQFEIFRSFNKCVWNHLGIPNDQPEGFQKFWTISRKAYRLSDLSFQKFQIWKEQRDEVCTTLSGTRTHGLMISI